MYINDFIKMLNTDMRWNLGYLRINNSKNKTIAFGSMDENDNEYWAKSETKTSAWIRKILWSNVQKVEFSKEIVTGGDLGYGWFEKEVDVATITTL